MKTWTIRFRGGDERETLANADHFFLANKEEVGLSRAEFFARLLVSEDGKEAVFVAPDEPLWNLPPDTASFGDRPLGTEPGLDDHSEQDLPQGLRTAGEDEEPVPAGPESVAAEEST